MNIIRNNKQIIMAGFGLGIFFLVVIYISINRQQEANLSQVNEIPLSNNNSPFSVSQRSPNVIDEGINKKLEETKTAEDINKLSNNKPKAIFVYTNEGWSPKSANIEDGDYVKWVNLADRDIVVSELVIGQTAFKTPVTIKPNASFDTQINRSEPSGYWTFKEMTSGEIGRVFAYPN